MYLKCISSGNDVVDKNYDDDKQKSLLKFGREGMRVCARKCG